MKNGQLNLKEILENVRRNAPLVHNITNYVTVNDCANVLLACGGSPIMSDDPGEVEEITSICGGLTINIGTLNQHTIPSMFLAGKKANALGHPVVLDPVGAGASKLRTETAKKLLSEVKFAAIRGNISEIKALALGGGTTKGVDADVADAVTEETMENVIGFAREFSGKTGAIVVITGAVDIVTDSEKTYLIRNGHPVMSKITGSGCMLSTMLTAYLVANPGQPLEGAAACLCAMGLCGERAFERMEKEGRGNSSFRNDLIDEIYQLDGETLTKGAKYELRE